MTPYTDTGSPLDALDALIGNTPLLEIHYRLDGRPGRLFAKYELENMTGSVKDRIAKAMLEVKKFANPQVSSHVAHAPDLK